MRDTAKPSLIPCRAQNSARSWPEAEKAVGARLDCPAVVRQGDAALRNLGDKLGLLSERLPPSGPTVQAAFSFSTASSSGCLPAMDASGATREVEVAREGNRRGTVVDGALLSAVDAEACATFAGTCSSPTKSASGRPRAQPVDGRDLIWSQ